MDNQLSIFDIFSNEKNIDYDNATDDEMIAAIENVTGLNFAFNNFFGEYQSKIKNNTFTISKIKYIKCFNRKGVLLGWHTKNEGCGMASANFNETIRFFKRILSKIKE